MSLASKIAKVIGSSLQLGIDSNAVLLKWTAALFSFRNKADSGYAGIAAQTAALYDSAGTHKTTLGMPTGATADLTLNLPATAGSAGQVIQTDGAGNLSFASAGSTAACLTVDTTSLAFGSTSPVTMFTLPANAVVTMVSVVVDTAFNGTPTMSVGVTGALSKYVAATDVDLTTAAEYEVSPGLTSDGSSEALIITYSAGSATAGAARVLVYYSVPS